MLRMSHWSGALVGLLLMGSGTALADTWDLNLARLSRIELQAGEGKQWLDGGGGYGGQKIKRVVADNAAFRSLMSELGAVFAPNILQPSDTGGLSGFSFNVEFNWTMVNPKRRSRDPVIDCASHKWDSQGNCTQPGQGTPFWRAAKSVSAAAFAKGDIRTTAATAEIDRLNNELPPQFASTVAVMARKGLWFPVPSFEMGVGFKHLINSRMWAPVAQVKLAIHEGFQGWPIPAIAVRGSGSRVMGTPDFNLTVAGIDVSISKHLGLGSTLNLTPYAGYQFLWIIADSEVVDATPAYNAVRRSQGNLPQDKNGNYDPTRLNQCYDPDCAGLFAFTDQGNITRHRGFFGFKLNFYIATLMLEYSFFASGSKSDELYEASGAGQVYALSVPDFAGTQHTISFSLGLDF